MIVLAQDEAVEQRPIQDDVLVHRQRLAVHQRGCVPADMDVGVAVGLNRVTTGSLLARDPGDVDRILPLDEGGGGLQGARHRR
jgi:hypothetical protein